MESKNYQQMFKTIFLAFFSFVFLTRILILTENYTWTLDPVRLQIIYLIATTLMMITARGGRIRLIQGKFWLVMIPFVIHTLLWGTVFLDDTFADLIITHFRSQIMFAVMVLITTLAVHQFDARKEFLKCCYYTLVATMIYFFVTNISELDLSNLANIMTAKDRTRTSFGFGHYNTLGACCVCSMLLWNIFRKEHKAALMKIIDALIIVVVIVMLLSCASRSALTSLVVYAVVYYAWRIGETQSKKVHSTIKVLCGFAVVLVVLWTFLEVDYMEMLSVAQRALIFTHTLPMFFATDKIWFGLGYASNVAYATNQTPYQTYWMDNAFAYYLVTTGIVGVTILVYAAVVLGKELYKRVNLPLGKEAFGAFWVYLYVSMFELAFFNSGVIVSYVYLSWFLLHIAQKKKEDTLKNVQQ